MATATTLRDLMRNGYPTTDGKPMAETDRHRTLMFELIGALQIYFAAARMVYVSGNLLLFYERGNKRRHVSPDVFVVKGVPKHERPNYLLWEEGKGPGFVIELTSSSTRREDVQGKFVLYRDVLRVPEYFLFDPFGDHLDPPLQGYRLRGGKYQQIRLVNGRLPSRVIGLHLERNGSELRLYDPATGQWLPTDAEARRRVEVERDEVTETLCRVKAERDAATETSRHAEAERDAALEARRRAEVEVERLRRELEGRRG